MDHPKKRLKKEAKDRFTTQERRREIAKIDEFFAREIAESKHTSSEILTELAVHPSSLVRWGVASNRNTPVDTLIKLADDSNDIVVKYIAENPNTPAFLLPKLASHPFWGVRLSLVQRKDITPELLLHLSKDEKDDVRSKIATNPKTPSTILEILSQDKAPHVKWHVGGNPNTPISILENFANHEDGILRSSVAANRAIPIHLQIKLSQDQHPQVQENLAYNRNVSIETREAVAKLNLRATHTLSVDHTTPTDVLKRLASIDDDSILYGIAQNPNSDPSTLEHVFNVSVAKPYRGQGVFEALIRNSNTPQHILEKLANHPHRKLSYKAIKKLNL